MEQGPRVPTSDNCAPIASLSTCLSGIGRQKSRPFKPGFSLGPEVEISAHRLPIYKKKKALDCKC